MAQGRVSAMFATTSLALSFLLIVSHTELARAATITVGGNGGWTFNVSGWPKGKTFRAGDILVFKYARGYHNVVVGNSASYQKCTTPKGARIYSSGNDQIKLVKGQNFFICSFGGHCESGMKIAVNAS